MKILNNILKALTTLLLISPIMGVLQIFPEPTADMYNTPEAYSFVKILMDSQYITVMQAVVFLIAIFCLWTKRVPLASILLLPITLNIVGFHAFLDGGLFTAGALMGNILLALNIYFLWQSRAQLKFLLKKTSF